MAVTVKRSHEKVLTRAQAVVPVATASQFNPTTDNLEGAALAVVLFDTNGQPYNASGGGGGGGAVTIADGADVTQGAIADVAYTGTATTSQGYLRAIADQAISTSPAGVQGATSADSPITAPPVTVGYRAANATPSAVSANGDVVNGMSDLYGRQIVRESLRENKGVQTTTITSSTTETTIVTAAANTFNDIFRLTIFNTSATSTQVTIRDGTAGTIRYSPVIAGGASWGFSGSISSAATQAAVNTNWTAQCGTSVASVVITAEFVKNP